MIKIVIGFLLIVALFLSFHEEKSSDMLSIINEERAAVGLPPLFFDKSLEETALIKACDMRDRYYFSHDDPEGNKSWHIFQEHGLDYQSAGENLVRDAESAEQAMEWLMASPSHRDNILNEQFVFVGYATCGDYTVQHFLAPKHDTL